MGTSIQTTRRTATGSQHGFPREIAAPALGLAPADLYLKSPYRGGNAAQLAWNMAVMSAVAETYEMLGADDEVEALGHTIELVAKSSGEGGVAQNARRDFADAVDLIYGLDGEPHGVSISLPSVGTSSRRLSLFYCLWPRPPGKCTQSVELRYSPLKTAVDHLLHLSNADGCLTIPGFLTLTK